MAETGSSLDKRPYPEDAPYQLDETNPAYQVRVRAIIGELYYRQFFILWALTFTYYLFVVVRDIFLAPEGIAWMLHASNASVILLLLATYIQEKRGKIDASNIYLAPIPISIAMVLNVYFHVVLTEDVNILARGLLLIMAFSVVSMLPWVFWLLTGFATVSHIVVAYSVMGPESSQLISVGIGAMMVSYGGFVVRYNSIREQARLNIQNQERAEKLTQLGKAKDDFIANMSHELRTPLTGLMGMVDLLDKAPLRSEDRHYLNTAKTSAETLRVVINDILDLSKLGAGKLKLVKAPFDMTTLLSEVSEMMAVGAKDKGVGLALKLPENDTPRVIGDQARLRQILFNILGNAVKFTEKGQVVLSAEILSDSDQYITLRLCVEDTGIGIAEDDLIRLFGRFEQADSSSTRRHAGTGLGLSICLELLELMGSEIKVESRYGRGSKFWFDLKLEKGAPAVKETSRAKRGQVSAENILERPMKILVAEDNPINQMLIRKLTESEHWTPVFVVDGKQALEKAEGTAFDIILMDIQMPVMNGEEATRKIRAADGPNKETPIIALTANCMPDDVERYLLSGITASIAKPIKLDEFYQTIAKHVSE